MDEVRAAQNAIVARERLLVPPVALFGDWTQTQLDALACARVILIDGLSNTEDGDFLTWFPKPRVFDMSTWCRKDRNCGTRACLGGIAEACIGLDTSGAGFPTLLFPMWSQSNLFCAFDTDPYAITERAAALCLERFLYGDHVVDWTRAMQ